VSRPAPRRLAVSLERLRSDLAPASRLARVQTIWERAVGPTIAAQARPTAERDGVLTVLCSASVWAAELTMMASEVLEQVNEALGQPPASPPLIELRCRTR
jgi:predicted nucleic acid-binding Zn ribbon protein